MNTPTDNQLPSTGLAGLKQNWRHDLFAGFLVFLLALPLCLGISIASGFPPASGIITALIGGLLVSRINGSHITINGPAAGLIVVIYSSVQSLGEGDPLAGCYYTLAAIVFAGALQILLGYYKAGQLSSFFPATVIHGMLAAIGIIIMAKQSHIMLGINQDFGGILTTIQQLPNSLLNPTPEIAYIGVSGLLLLFFWPMIKQPVLKKIPAPLIVLISGMLLGQFYGLQHEHIHFFLLDQNYLANHQHIIQPQFLVDIPDQFTSIFFFPDFGKVMTLPFWGAVISICLVGSLESLLSTVAVDKLDPYHRHSDLDRDLTAIGTGNMVAGFLGGLPMIAEIVRSSANVDNGARTGWSNFFHALFFLVFFLLFPHLIHSIPLATLAALLVYTGFRLTSPKTFKEVFEVGVEQLAVFLITIIGVLTTDLLFGVTLGILAKLILQLIRGVWPENMFKIHYSIDRPNPTTVVIKLTGSALFSNFLPLKRALAELEPGKTIIFDFSDGYLIDHTVIRFIDEFSRNYIRQGGQCRQIGQPIETFSDHKLASRLMTKDDRKH